MFTSDKRLGCFMLTLAQHLCLQPAISINVVRLKSSEKTRPQCFVGLFFMNNFIKIIPAHAGHCTANYNLLFSPGMTDFDEFIHKNPT